MTGEIQEWADRLEAFIARAGIACIGRVSVLAETASTQDAALSMSGGRPGLLVLAGRQTAGRGRLGRQWADTADAGLAATFVLPALDPGTLSLAAGLGACLAVEGHCDASVGLRWPNDIVERRGAGRKIAGILVEARDGVSLVGIGLNVGQGEADWPPALRGRAVSLRMLGSKASRIEAAESLLVALDRALGLPAEDLGAEWAVRDVVIGTRREFESGGQRIAGTVEAIRPTSFIQVRTDDGRVVQLPALTTSLVKE